MSAVGENANAVLAIYCFPSLRDQPTRRGEINSDRFDGCFSPRSRRTYRSAGLLNARWGFTVLDYSLCTKVCNV